MIKYPLKRVEINIDRAVKVLQIDVSRLEKHNANLMKYKERNDVQSLVTEQVNASRTVQQLRANIKQLKQLRLQVQDNDVPKFDLKVAAIQQHSADVLANYVKLNELGCETGTDCSRNSAGFGNAGSSTDSEPTSENPLQQTQLQQQELKYPDENVHELETDVVELNSLMRDFATIVHSQRETVDTIEENVEATAQNVNSGAISLSKAAKYKTAMLPLTGALVGTLIGGPVGLVAGLKIGALAAAGGSVAGFAGGRVWHKRRTAEIDENESERRLSNTCDTSGQPTDDHSLLGNHTDTHDSDSISGAIENENG